MNISLTIKSLLIFVIFSFAFLSQIVYAAHSTHPGLRPSCTPPITSAAQRQQCVAKINELCNAVVSGGGADTVGGFNTCVSDYSSDIVIEPATPTTPSPAAPTGGGGAAALNNPLAIGDMQDLFEAVMTAFIIMCVPFIVFFVILAGFQYVTAQGSPEKIKSASKALLYAVIGAVIIVGAIAITTLVGNTVNEF